MFSIALVPSVLLAVGMVFSPESPRWLYQVTFVKFIGIGGGSFHDIMR